MAAEIATPRALVIARPGDCADRTKGYLRQKDLIGLVEAMGFERVAASEINTNPRDARDHAVGVWEMKPNWSTKRAELEHLGETGRCYSASAKPPFRSWRK